MMTEHKRQKTLLKIARYFDELPPGRIDQGKAKYKASEPCCVGAHLAHLLSTSGKAIHYSYGFTLWTETMGLKRSECLNLLRKHGSSRSPTGTKPWPTPPAVVFRRIAEEMEKVLR